MKFNRKLAVRIALLVSLIINLTVISTRHHADTGTCGGQTTTVPFTDVMGSGFFCQIAEAYFSGLANGTSATTYNPSGNVTRDQMSAFITRTLDQSLKRGSRRAALNQWWTPLNGTNIRTSAVGSQPGQVVSDGADLWVANFSGGSVTRVRGSDGTVL